MISVHSDLKAGVGNVGETRESNQSNLDFKSNGTERIPPPPSNATPPNRLKYSNYFNVSDYLCYKILSCLWNVIPCCVLLAFLSLEHPKAAKNHFPLSEWVRSCCSLASAHWPDASSTVNIPTSYVSYTRNWSSVFELSSETPDELCLSVQISSCLWVT